MSQNTQNVQDEFDNTKGRFVDEKAIIRDRLGDCLKDIRKMRKEKDTLSETTKDMDAELKAKEEA